MFDEVLKIISTTKLNAVIEKVAQKELEDSFINNGISVEREYKLSQRDIVDFSVKTELGLVVIELKIKAKRMSIFRQLCRYAKHDEVAAVVLLTGTAMRLPALIENKPAAVISLGEAWL
ncbi:MAG: hypothetical protein ACRDBQ_23230 [Shewanella sp.]